MFNNKKGLLHLSFAVQPQRTACLILHEVSNRFGEVWFRYRLLRVPGENTMWNKQSRTISTNSFEVANEKMINRPIAIGDWRYGPDTNRWPRIISVDLSIRLASTGPVWKKRIIMLSHQLVTVWSDIFCRLSTRVNSFSQQQRLPVPVPHFLIFHTHHQNGFVRTRWISCCFADLLFWKLNTKDQIYPCRRQYEGHPQWFL